MKKLVLIISLLLVFANFNYGQLPYGYKEFLDIDHTGGWSVGNPIFDLYINPTDNLIFLNENIWHAEDCEIYSLKTWNRLYEFTRESDELTHKHPIYKFLYFNDSVILYKDFDQKFYALQFKENKITISDEDLKNLQK